MFSHIKTCLVLFLICICSYFNILMVPFQFDGVRYIQENAHIVNLVEKNDYQAYFAQYYPTNIFNRPVLNYTYTLNYYLGKDRTFGYHLIDLWLHFGCCWFIYLIFRKIRILIRQDRVIPPEQQVNLPLIAALLFASHPVQTQAITYIMSRSASLCTFLYLASFYCFLLAIEAKKDRSTVSATQRNLFMAGMILLSLLLMRLALGVKLIIASLPLVIGISFFLLFCPENNIKRFLYKRKLLLGAIIVLPALWVIFGKSGFFPLLNDPGAGVYSRSSYLLSQITWFVFYYLKIWLFPFNLNIDPNTHAITGFADIRLIVAILALALLVAFIRKQSVLVIFGFLWVIVALAPESSLIPLLDLVTEHRLYLPGAGFVLIIATLLSARKWVLFHVLLILCFTIGTIHRNQDWISEKSLWQDAVKKSPNKWRPLSNYARALDLAGDRDGAALAYQKAIKIDTNHFETHHNLANIHVVKGNCVLAIEEYNVALSLSPDLPESLIGIGRCYKTLGNYDKAILYFKHVLEIDPAMDIPYRELGWIYYFPMNDRQTATFYLRQALRLNPNHPGNATIEKLIN